MIITPKNGFFWGFMLSLTALSVIALTFGFRQFFSYRNSPEYLTAKFQEQIIKQEPVLKESVENLTRGFDTIRRAGAATALPESQDGFYLFVFRDDSLVLWNDNQVILPPGIVEHTPGSCFITVLKNGWFGFYLQRTGRYTCLGGYLIRSKYPFQNEFLDNRFSRSFGLPVAVELTNEKGKYPVFNSRGTYMASLDFSAFDRHRHDTGASYFLLYLAAQILFSFLLYHFIKSAALFKRRPVLLVWAYLLILGAVRAMQQHLGVPAGLYAEDLFAPGLYSSSAILPSLGDLALDMTALLAVALAASRTPFEAQAGISRPGILHIARAALSLLGILLLFQAAGFLIRDLVLNSNVSLNLLDISRFSAGSILGLYVVAGLLLSLWIVSHTVFSRLVARIASRNQAGVILLAVILVYSVVAILAGWKSAPATGGCFSLFVLVHYLSSSRNKTGYAFGLILFDLLVFSTFATFILNQANREKEQARIQLLAWKVVTQRNPVTEMVYEQTLRKMQADTVWKNTTNGRQSRLPVTDDSLARYVGETFFNDYWKKYQVQVTVCDKGKELRIQPQGYLTGCHDYFSGIIRSYGGATSVPGLYFLDYGLGKEFYLAVWEVPGLDSLRHDSLCLYIEFNLKNSYPDPGYPGLLVDRTRVDLPPLSEYTYALYHQGYLVRSSGPVAYKRELDQYQAYSGSQGRFAEEGIRHFIYRVDQDDLLLISRKKGNLLSYATPFSYLFILFSLIALGATLAYRIPQPGGIFPVSLRNRLSLFLIGILVITMVALGIIQVNNIIRINYQKNLDNLRERIHSIGVEIQHKYSRINDMNEIPLPVVSDFLVKLSNVFFTDINIYRESGMLFSSSRPQVFDEGLISERMNPAAFQRMILETSTIYVHDESIGDMKFNSAYLPFFNEQGRLLGYINLPYFARQDEMKQEVSSFLVTFLNLYILLILAGVLFAAVISNYITAPLSLLTSKISQLRLGVANEKITWNQRDEVGQLVEKYNRMIDELANSAEMLARSERESAWREMARQVAHEIKNPLTPMKLSVQYLEKAWREKAPDWDQRLTRFTQTLVEQIDTLSVVAGDFSDFAKMPPVVLTPVDPAGVIRSVLTMYENTPGVRFEFTVMPGDPRILADTHQLNRMFTNLINNAVQAVSGRPDSLISIELDGSGTEVFIRISDNGTGIPPERAEMIFQPDFTTKSGGMGLGLAIVKGIVHGMKGKITVNSIENEGTTFTVIFPALGR